jgi:hypothetical protein
MSILRVKIKRRLLYLAFGAAAFLIAYSVGAAIPLTYQDAQEVRKQFSEQVRSIDQNGIFFNNVRIALGMFIPAAGAALGIFSGFSTGTVFSALVNSSTALKGVPPLAILITPFGIMEVFSYGLAMSRSGMLVYQLLKKRPWQEYFVPTLIELGIVVIVLFAAAMVEWQMIQQLGGIETSTIIGT